jgi:hypothetical protein
LSGRSKELRPTGITHGDRRSSTSFLSRLQLIAL